MLDLYKNCSKVDHVNNSIFMSFSNSLSYFFIQVWAKSRHVRSSDMDPTRPSRGLSPALLFFSPSGLAILLVYDLLRSLLDRNCRGEFVGLFGESPFDWALFGAAEVVTSCEFFEHAMKSPFSVTLFFPWRTSEFASERPRGSSGSTRMALLLSLHSSRLLGAYYCAPGMVSHMPGVTCSLRGWYSCFDKTSSSQSSWKHRFFRFAQDLIVRNQTQDTKITAYSAALQSLFFYG